MRNGFTLLEVIIVIAILAIGYSVAIPQFNLKTGTEVTAKVNQVVADIASASDIAVLSGQVYRMVFKLTSGDYWLEVADRRDITLGDQKIDHDLTEVEEKDQADQFEESFQKYVELAGEEVKDPDSDKMVKPTSPVVEAKDKLKPVKWTKVTDLEWSSEHSIGPYLMFQDIQGEHHGAKQDFSVLGKDARVVIHFFPNGYIERAALHIAYKKNDQETDTSAKGYTIKTNSDEGTADIVDGYEEYAEADK